MDIAARFSANLVRLRKAAGLTQEELAFRAAVHRTQVGLLETGKRLPRFETLIKISGALEVSPSELAEGIVWEPIVNVDGGFKVDPR